MDWSLKSVVVNVDVGGGKYRFKQVYTVLDIIYTPI